MASTANPSVAANETEPGLAADLSGQLSDDSMIVKILETYRTEATTARESGENPRDNKWRENLDLYWNRYDFSQKAPWQSKVVMPEVPQFVDRFAAAMTEALMTPERFFTVSNPHDREDDITNAVAKMMDVWLAGCGRAPDGSVLGYDAVFEETMKCGALLNAAQVVAPKLDAFTGETYVAVETVDPRRLWLDHTSRQLYRVHRQEMDLHTLMRTARQKDTKGKALYKVEAVEQLVATVLGTLEDDQRRMSGGGTSQTSHRKPVILDEYLCTLLTPGGKELMRNALCVVANQTVLVRGPEENPFWHKRDWVVNTPLVTVPLSVYGRSYMEDFGSLARLFTELTNMIVDAVYTTSLKVFGMVTGMLEDPTQIDDGLYPNALFRLEQFGRPEDFLRAVDLGALSPDAVRVWQIIKTELETAAMLNDITRGQFAPKGRTSAQEVATVEQNASAMIRSVARTVERRLVEPVLDRVWRTGLQTMKKGDKALRAAVGDAMFDAIWSQRKDFASSPFTFRVRAISGLIAKSQKLRMLLQTLAVIGRAPFLMQSFMTKYSPDKLLDVILELHNIDAADLQISERERMMQALAQQGQGTVPGAGPQGPRPLAVGGAPGQAGAPVAPAGI
jgi:hypothetical protein